MQPLPIVEEKKKKKNKSKEVAGYRITTAASVSHQPFLNHDIAQDEKKNKPKKQRFNAAFVATNVDYLWASKTSGSSPNHNEIIVIRFVLAIEQLLQAAVLMSLKVETVSWVGLQGLSIIHLVLFSHQKTTFPHYNKEYVILTCMVLSHPPTWVLLMKTLGTLFCPVISSSISW